MHGKICLVTGATAGIGEVTARELARQGATVIVVGRSREKSETTVRQIRQQTGNPAVEYLLADLSSQKDVRALAQQFKSTHQRLHALVNNAGGIFIWRQASVDGIEMTFALNHLNYFLLTNLLLDALKASAPARIINVSSRAHLRAPLNFDALQSRRGYNGIRVYGQTKLANLLFTYELARRLEGTGVTANALHPGLVATNFGANNARLGGRYLGRLYRRLFRVIAISAEEGAQSSLYLATSPEVAGVTGKYFVRRQAVPSSEASYDRAAASRLWQVSEELTDLAVGA